MKLWQVTLIETREVEVLVLAHDETTKDEIRDGVEGESAECMRGYVDPDIEVGLTQEIGRADAVEAVKSLADSPFLNLVNAAAAVSRVDESEALKEWLAATDPAKVPGTDEYREALEAEGQMRIARAESAGPEEREE
jgi:hypothetical protein